MVAARSTTPESVIQAEILLALGSRPDVRLWRASVLTARSLRTGKTYTAGLPGQADLTGFIQPEGWRLEVEVKTATGKQRPEQAAFERVITSGGGCYLLARSVADATAQLDAWISSRRARGCPHCASGSLEHAERCRCACHLANRSGE